MSGITFDDWQQDVEPIFTAAIDTSLFENVHICRDEDFQSLVIRAAENTGGEFLFEIPAAMIGENGKIAAAMRVPTDEESQYLFVVACSQTGSVDFLQESDVDTKLVDFVDSYTAVLNQLAQAGDTVQSLH